MDTMIELQSRMVWNQGKTIYAQCLLHTMVFWALMSPEMAIFYN